MKKNEGESTKVVFKFNAVCLIIFLMPAVTAVTIGISMKQVLLHWQEIFKISVHLWGAILSVAVRGVYAVLTGCHVSGSQRMTNLRRFYSTGVSSGCEYKNKLEAKIHLITESLHMFLNGRPLAHLPHISASTVSRCFHPSIHTCTHTQACTQLWQLQTSQRSARKN